ncbi:PiggyBac transposable element-derived protein 4 [Oopsacas minuta]|uniref:PiggyBac transposable element-derived protein 4 n=1 Tax=Oopsacas minuta TaxID=111878 RepID=A0AAV7JJ38_9METZ|nr:PiggyBac transposable element-derived protein 4 [Oopsacas minuta]
MSRIYTPGRNLSLDESMVLWRGRLVFRQYIKNKRHKYGIKLFQLCESDGIVLRVAIYSGESFFDEHMIGQTGAIVLHLMRDYLDKGYCVFTDNYYTSVTLTKIMSERSTYICGTLRPDRKGNPQTVIQSKLKRGEYE